MSQSAEFKFVLSPHPIIYLFCDNYLRSFHWEGEYKDCIAAFNGNLKPAAQAFSSYRRLGFTDGLQTEDAKPDGDRLVFSGPSLMQLLIFHNTRNELTGFSTAAKVIPIYFEGDDRSNAQTYFEEVICRLAGRTDTGSAWVNFVVAQERALRRDFWGAVFGNCTYDLK